MLVILERILPDPDGLAVVVAGRVLETVRGDQDVVEELEADVDPFLAAVLDLAFDADWNHSSGDQSRGLSDADCTAELLSGHR